MEGQQLAAKSRNRLKKSLKLAKNASFEKMVPLLVTTTQLCGIVDVLN